MSHQTRTPRPPPGDGLVPLMIRVTPDMRAQLEAYAKDLDVSEAAAARIAIAFFFDHEPRMTTTRTTVRGG